MWLEVIAGRTDGRSDCLEVVGHASPTGPEPLNQRLSLLRAQYVQGRLVEDGPPLAERSMARGVGSRQSIVGTGSEDASDALDRRVELAVRGCEATAAGT
jgi:outer membrane protein OmpA-like peptidoglycan-associated protein